MQFCISGKKDVNKFGFGFIENREKCHVHKFNDLPIKIDLSEARRINFNGLDQDINLLFKSLLTTELKNAGVRNIHSIEWDRVFLFNSFLHGEDDLKKFTVRFWIRIYGEKGMSEGVSVIGGK